MSKTEYMIPTRRSRLIALGRLLAILAAVFILIQLIGYIDEKLDPLCICAQLPWLRLFTLVICAILLGSTALATRQCWRIYKHNQYPWPGAQLFFRARIHRGWLATYNALYPLLASLLSFAALLYLLFGLGLYLLFTEGCSIS